MDAPKKYWWLIGIVVPIIIAIIGIAPKFMSKKGNDESFHVNVVGTQFNGRVAFNDITIVAEQTRQKLGIELPQNLLADLQKALNLVKAKNFTDAIPVLESVAEAAPVPAALNNLGAAYLATGNKDKAISTFEKSLTLSPKLETAQFNLGQLTPEKDKSNTKTVQFIGNSEQEPNDSILQANIIKIGQKVGAEISKTDDHDFFKFQYTAELRDKVNITFENKSTSLRPNVKIYDKNKSEVLDRYNGTYGANLEIILSMDPGSEFYIQVLPYDSSGKYLLSMIALHAFDSHEPNDDPFSATGMKIGQVISGNIMDSKDTDWFQLTGINSEEVTVRLENRSTSLRPNIKIYDKNKSEILDRYNGTYGADLEFLFKAEPLSYYYIRLLPYDSHGEYKLSAR